MRVRAWRGALLPALHPVQQLLLLSPHGDVVLLQRVRPSQRLLVKLLLVEVVLLLPRILPHALHSATRLIQYVAQVQLHVQSMQSTTTCWTYLSHTRRPPFRYRLPRNMSASDHVRADSTHRQVTKSSPAGRFDSWNARPLLRRATPAA